MKKILFLFAMIAILMASCDDDYIIHPEDDNEENNDNNGNGDGDGNNVSNFLILDGLSNTGQTHEGHPVYQYRLRISRDKYMGENPITETNLSVPRVHNGETTYTNQDNAPYFGITGLDANWVSITVRCRVHTSAPEPLKFNVAVGANPPTDPGYWFVAIHLSSDDGVTNMNHIRFETDKIVVLKDGNAFLTLSL